jgi:hypothetical protein
MGMSALRRVPTYFLAVVVALVLFALSSGNASAVLTTTSPSFSPTIDYSLCNGLPDNFPIASIQGPNPYPGGCSPDDLTPGGNPDITSLLSIPLGDINFAPQTMILTQSSDFLIAGDAAFVDGTLMGGISNTVSLGLTTSPCDNTLPGTSFAWYDATTDVTNQLAVPEGVANRFSPTAKDTLPPAIMADPDSPGVSQFPDFTVRLFDPDGSGGGPNTIVDGSTYDPVTPHARYFGATQVPGGRDWQTLQVIIFEPGELQASFMANPATVTHPYARLGPDQGWITLIMLNDPISVEGSPQYVSDFCTPLSANGMLLGAPGGTPRVTSPPAPPGPGIDGQGTHLGGMYILSYRDWDEDGIQNDMDTCPHMTNLEDPYVSAGGPGPWGAGDDDQFDPACDPGPNTNENFGDFDADGYYNGQDNCPAVGNSYGAVGPGYPANWKGTRNQEETEVVTAHNLAAPDGGLITDEMGDSCDSQWGYYDHTNIEDPGPNQGSCIDDLNNDPLQDAVKDAEDPDCFDNIGTSDTTSDGVFLYGMDTEAFCIGGVDANSDGWCDGGGMSEATLDTDGDTSPDRAELFMNTDPIGACPENNARESWPADMDNNKTINLLDLVLGGFKAAFNTDMNDPLYDRRVDLENSGSAPGGAKDINLLDLVLGGFKAAFNTSCSPVTKVCYIKIVDSTVKSYGCTPVQGPAGTWTATIDDGCTDGGGVAVWAGIWKGGTVTGSITCPAGLGTVGASCVVGPNGICRDPPTGSRGPKDAGALVCTMTHTGGGTKIVICMDP